MDWRSLAYLIVAPVYLAVASAVFLALRFSAALILSSPTDQIALALIGTGVVLTGCSKLFMILDE